jgi:HAE1 family hydrophobic/amphiphilic exporter-1
MTTFALIAGMMPVALGLGEGGEFYQPLAVSIIGGTITSTLLTLLVVPSFYDSIESASERMRAKIRTRSLRYPAALSLLVTLFEALATLLLLRFLWRNVVAGSLWMRRRTSS